ncbi:helix-turn-helix domain-containing protein [Ketobacter sp.]|uniref:helix-turn-helix domain-containing protein n=1 Tax=Ketobacter sp. TaxID=2083498 RepID=UPI0026CA40D3
MDLGGTIKQCRKVKKLTLAQLSKECGISVSYLSLLENNNREPSINTVESISKALGLPLSVLIFLASQRNEEIELSVSHIEALSNNIMELMVNVKG